MGCKLSNIFIGTFIDMTYLHFSFCKLPRMQPGLVFLVKSFSLLVTITHGNISVSPSHCTNTKKRSGVKKTIKIIP